MSNNSKLEYAKKIDFITKLDTHKNQVVNSTFNLQSTDNAINLKDIKVIKPFSGGKSGDTVLLIQIGNTKYVLRVFSNYKRFVFRYSKSNNNKKAHQNEIDRHLDFMKLFQGSYIPCPIIYYYGKLLQNESNSNEFQTYFIMEHSDGPELDYHIGSICEDKLSTLNKYKYTKINMIHIIIELFYVISKMILADFTHCDLHSKNIILVKIKGNSILDLNDIGIDKKYILSGYRIKILDFGLSVQGIANGNISQKCTKLRDITSAIMALRTKCNGSSLSSFSRLITSHSGNTDLLLLCNIIKALITSGKIILDFVWMQKINIEKFRKIAETIAITKSNSKTQFDNKKKLIKDAFKILTDDSRTNTENPINTQTKTNYTEICVHAHNKPNGNNPGHLNITYKQKKPGELPMKNCVIRTTRKNNSTISINPVIFNHSIIV